ncbi:hypothetical protein [Sporosarcina sp. Marseille-Q4943]|uniref:DUF6978 family protein n=1 Tax=Sporosarcina sp. Marseille-Q4943 TaxID=2942204 RepID=UPI00208DB817|nr:hypothetical protein [Sporosarcina sp. Marseille-Q4943]
MDQQKINELISSLKMILSDNKNIDIPEKGLQDYLQLKSIRTNFTIVLNRKGNKSPKFTLQLSSDNYRSRPLLRLDILGPDHANPDGDFPYASQIIPCPHIHVAHEIFGMSIAYPLNEEYANMCLTDQELKDLVTILNRFLKRCNVSNIEDYNFKHQMELL